MEEGSSHSLGHESRDLRLIHPHFWMSGVGVTPT